MPRIKHVFDDDDQIRDLWIAGDLDWARQRNGTSSFEGPRFWRKLGGSAVRFPGPDGVTYCITDRGTLPVGWQQIPLHLTRILADAGERLNSGRQVDALEVIRVAIDREIGRYRLEAKSGQVFSGAQAGRLRAVADLHAIRMRLSEVYRMRWKPLLDQAAAEALAAFTARGSNHVAKAKTAREAAIYNHFRNRVAGERSTPVDDETSIREWVANERLYLNAAPRSGPQTYLRVNGTRVENSHGPCWKIVEFNRIARYLIDALREDRFFDGRNLERGLRVQHIDGRGVTLQLYRDTYNHLPLTSAEVGAILEQTAPRLAASLALAQQAFNERAAEEQDRVLEMVRHPRP